MAETNEDPNNRFDPRVDHKVAKTTARILDAGKRNGAVQGS